MPSGDSSRGIRSNTTGIAYYALNAAAVAWVSLYEQTE